MERLESDYPVVAMRCHDLVDAGRLYLLAGGECIARQSARVPKSPQYVRTLSDYYAKLHTVSTWHLIFLKVAAAVFAATDDVRRGMWAIDVVETAFGVGLDVVAVAAVEAGIDAGAAQEPDAVAYMPSVAEGIQVVSDAVFGTALALIEQ